MPELAAFLIQPAHEGYPTDYLVARIMGRRPNLVTDWLSHLVPPGPPETLSPLLQRTTSRGMTAAQARLKMREEFRWVYLQMNEGERKTFAPFFLWFEVRTILICLRFRRGGEREKAAALLASSLLAQRVQLVLSGEGKPFARGDALTDLLAAVAEPGLDLGAIREQGGREFEQRFVALYLERMTRLTLHPVLREFFRSVVDMANLLSLAKQMRWQLVVPRAFIRGGAIATKRLEGLLKERSAARLAVLLRSQPGVGGLPAVPDNLEQFLLCGLTRKVRKLAREPLGIGLILDYLWGRFVEARNASLVHHGAVLGDETLRAELIG
jgi:hypothetical protein